jgi:hypothetical protein
LVLVALLELERLEQIPQVEMEMLHLLLVQD